MIRVGVIDSGIDPNHPALRGRVGPGWDYVEGDPVPQDGLGHGTHVAGILASETPPAVQICPLRVDAVGAIPIGHDLFAEGIRGALNYGCRVVNVSQTWGLTDPAQTLAAIRQAAQAGVLIVFAAGNDGRDLDARPLWPAGWEAEPNVLIVAAANRQGQSLWSGSNYGRTRVHVAAPGERVLGPRLLGGLELRSGTSMACARVSAMAATLLSERPTLTGQQAADAIKRGAVLLPTLVNRVSHGRPDLGRSRAAIRSNLIRGSAMPVQLWGTAGRDAYSGFIHQCLNKADEQHGGWVPFTRGARISRGVRLAQGLLRRGGPEFAEYAQAQFAGVDPGDVTLRGLVAKFFDWLETRKETLPLGGALLPQLRAICLTLITLIPIPPFLAGMRHE